MRSLIVLQLGAHVEYEGRTWVIRRVLSLSQIRAADLLTGRVATLPVADVGPPAPDASAEVRPERAGDDLVDVPEEAWVVARARLVTIEPVLELRPRTADAVRAAAQAAPRAARTGRVGDAPPSLATLYRWISAYERSGKLSSLLPRLEDRGGRTRKLDEETEDVIGDVATDLPAEHRRRGWPRPTFQQLYDAVVTRCRAADVAAPHPNTVRARFSELDVITRRARSRPRGRGPAGGHFPGADYPLAVVQIDHTQMDVECVDDERREPVGRPFLTLAIDVFSRCVVGFFVSLDPPSAMRVGICLVHAILPKDRWLAARQIDEPWPCWGRMRKVHADNGPDFRSKMLELACEEYRIGLEWRRVGKPEDGGHIERLMKTASKEIQRLPGSTASNPTARGDYDSRANARLTIAELERVLALWITGVYHQRRHRTLGVSPLERWTQGILNGTPGTPATGLPAREADPRKLELDFLPYVERKIQADGVHVDHIRYYDDELRDFMPAARSPGAPSPTYRFREDPRDRRKLYFFHPTSREYVEIRIADTGHYAPVTKWQIDAAQRRLREAERPVDEAATFAEIAASVRRQVDESTTRTLSVRANAETQRRRDHQRTRPDLPPSDPSDQSEANSHARGTAPADEADVVPFDVDEPPLRFYRP